MGIIKICAVAGTVSCCYLLYRRTRAVGANKFANKCVVITGCDSGLGYSLALHLSKKGVTVFACVLEPGSERVAFLKAVERETGFIKVCGLDITDPENVLSCSSMIEEAMLNNNLELLAVINNAGVMVFGEFEWLTEDLMFKHLEVNLMGTFRTTKAFLPALRKHRGRIINVTSHCSLEGLPGLSVYCASKAGLKAFSESLRVELEKFGIKVIQFIPGSFFAQSRIMGKQAIYRKEMEVAMSSEIRSTYGKYFNRYMSYLEQIPSAQYPSQIDDPNLYACIDDALFSHSPRCVYTNSPWRYKVYHFLFSISPYWLRDRLVKRFVSMPVWSE